MPKKRKVQRTGEQEVAYLVKQYLSDKKFTNSLLQFRMEAKSLLPSHQGVIAPPTTEFPRNCENSEFQNQIFSAYYGVSEDAI